MQYYLVIIRKHYLGRVTVDLNVYNPELHKACGPFESKEALFDFFNTGILGVIPFVQPNPPSETETSPSFSIFDEENLPHDLEIINPNTIDKITFNDWAILPGQSNYPS